MFTPDFIKGLVAGVACVLVLVLLIAIGFGLLKPWIRLKMMGGRGSLLYVLAMKVRGTPAMMIIDAYTTLLHSGEKVNLYLVESQYVSNRSKILSVADLVDHVRKYLKQQQAHRESMETRVEDYSS